MAFTLQEWRRQNSFTQVDAASLLGVSQPYLSLLESGARPLTKALRARMKGVNRSCSAESRDDRFRDQLSAFGYPPFAHVSPARVKPSPDVFLVSVLMRPDVDARVVEALPWMVRTYATRMNFPWLVQQAKLANLQNQMGFLLGASGSEAPKLTDAVDALEQARLLEEATLCWASMPPPTRKWVRQHRSPLARHWNLVTMLQPEKSRHAA